MIFWKDCTICEYESLRSSGTVLENCTYEDSSEEKLNLIITVGRQWVKRSIKQNLRIENFEARNGNHERNAVVKNQGQNSEQRRLPDNWVAYFRIWSCRSLSSISRKSSDIRKPIRCVQFTKPVVCQGNIPKLKSIAWNDLSR